MLGRERLKRQQGGISKGAWTRLRQKMGCKDGNSTVGCGAGVYQLIRTDWAHPFPSACSVMSHWYLKITAMMGVSATKKIAKCHVSERAVCYIFIHSIGYIVWKPAGLGR